MDIVELPLDGSPPRNLLATRRTEYGPAWSPVADQFAYVTDRRGVSEIWLKSRKEGWNRPLVTPRDFPKSGSPQFLPPVFSPDGTRIAYAVVRNDTSQIWISPVAGGPAIRLADDEGWSAGPTWSPDGSWVAYRKGRSLVKVQVGSQQPPVTIGEIATPVYPQWSPRGDWITTQLPEGFGVVSPAGLKKRLLSARLKGNNDVVHGWSGDGSSIYLTYREGTHTLFSALDLRTGSEKRIGDLGTEIAITGVWTATTRLSLMTDGKGLATSTRRYRGELWMLEGFDAPRTFWEKLWGP
jgi:Tol biopolymer transport system component